MEKIIRYNGQYCEMLGVIGDRCNFSIAIKLLSQGMMTAKEIEKQTGLTAKQVKTHLPQLTKCGYIFERKQRGGPAYSVNHETIKPLLKILNKHIESHKENKRRS